MFHNDYIVQNDISNGMFEGKQTTLYFFFFLCPLLVNKFFFLVGFTKQSKVSKTSFFSSVLFVSFSLDGVFLDDLIQGLEDGMGISPGVMRSFAIEC